MAFKTITIKESVYRELNRVKNNDESFSGLLERLVKEKKPRLIKYYGAWKGTEKELKRVEETVKRERHKKEERLNYSNLWK